MASKCHCLLRCSSHQSSELPHSPPEVDEAWLGLAQVSLHFLEAFLLFLCHFQRLLFFSH